MISSLETALVGLPESTIRNAVETGRKNAKNLLFWTEGPERILGSLYLLRLVFLICAGVIAFHEAEAFSGGWFAWLGALGASVLALLISHLIPRALAKRFALEWALRTINFVRFLNMLLLPIVWPLTYISKQFTRFSGSTSEGTTAFWTSDELGELSNKARMQVLGLEGRELYLSIAEFSDTVIREIMVPRTEVVAIPIESIYDDVRGVILEAGHSRIPVYEETVDNVVGLLHIKDLFVLELSQDDWNPESDFELHALLRSTFYVPEVMKIGELLREFQRRKTHMAIVVDEYGGTAGVVTLEDIIEEIVGEIQDEYDVEEKQCRMIGDGKIVADGRVNISDLHEQTGLGLPEDDSYETLAGFLMARSGYLPEQGAVLKWQGWRFTIKEANEKRIGMVEIDRLSLDK